MALLRRGLRWIGKLQVKRSHGSSAPRRSAQCCRSDACAGFRRRCSTPSAPGRAAGVCVRQHSTETLNVRDLRKASFARLRASFRLADQSTRSWRGESRHWPAPEDGDDREHPAFYGRIRRAVRTCPREAATLARKFRTPTSPSGVAPAFFRSFSNSGTFPCAQSREASMRLMPPSIFN